MNDTTTITTDRLAADETNQLISSEKVEGTAVYDRNGDHLGSVHHVMINKYTGQVGYAVMSSEASWGSVKAIIPYLGKC